MNFGCIESEHTKGTLGDTCLGLVGLYGYLSVDFLFFVL